MLDDLDRVVEGGEKLSTVADLHQAVLLTDKKLWKELEKFGLEVVEPVGAPFQAGYRFQGILLRPARVQVYGEQG